MRGSGGGIGYIHGGEVYWIGYVQARWMCFVSCLSAELDLTGPDAFLG
jgi:hypothetical protein